MGRLGGSTSLPRELRQEMAKATQQPSLGWRGGNSSENSLEGGKGRDDFLISGLTDWVADVID